MHSKPTIGIVLPLYKHSVLVEEAILSVLGQICDDEIILAIVNDGCPHDETDEVCKLYTNSYPEKISYVRKINGGLSSARNTGVEFLLSKFQSIKAIYFLDADNRIFPSTLSYIWKELKKQPKEVGWVYPDIDMFGIDYNLDTGGDFSILKILHQNYCEAGSMVRREVFESGAKYDEEMLLGYEDWEFWYQAISNGFIGKHVEYFGFQYRKRPESMLSNSTRDDIQIRSYMYQKHKGLFSIKNLLKLESNEAPRYNLIFDNNEIYQYLDPTDKILGILSEEDYIQNYLDAYFNPYKNHTPPIRVFASQKGWRALEEFHLLRWMHWIIEDMFESMNGFIVVTIESSNNNQVSVNIKHKIKKYTEIKDSVIIFAKRDLITSIMKDSTDSWYKSLYSNDIKPNVNIINIELPINFKYSEILMQNFDFNIQQLKSRYIKENDENIHLSYTWKKEDLLAINNLNNVPKNITELPSLYPMISDSISIGFILPLSSFGGVEKVTHNLANALKKLGYCVHLFIVQSSTYTQFDSFSETYDTVNFLLDEDAGVWSKEKTFFGVGTTTWHNNFNKQKRAVALLSGMNIVVNQHSIDTLAITGMLKRLGIKTVDYLHLLDKTNLDEDTGHPLVGIAYEHGFDKFVVISEKLRHLLHGMGVPREKIIVIPNAPSYEIPKDILKELQTKKEERQNEKLRILFIGRLDRQKGLERLSKIFNMTKTMNVEWRVVGKSILEGKSDNCAICQIAAPPVFTDTELTELYEWADCIVMPSYNEGVPLVMLEAMRLGAIPLCSNVGAIDEVIENGKNGFIFENNTRSLIMDFVLTIANLSENIEERKNLQKNAIISSCKYSWDKSAEVFKRFVINEL